MAGEGMLVMSDQDVWRRRVVAYTFYCGACCSVVETLAAYALADHRDNPMDWRYFPEYRDELAASLGVERSALSGSAAGMLDDPESESHVITFSFNPKVYRISDGSVLQWPNSFWQIAIEDARRIRSSWEEMKDQAREAVIAFGQHLDSDKSVGLDRWSVRAMRDICRFDEHVPDVWSVMGEDVVAVEDGDALLWPTENAKFLLSSEGKAILRRIRGRRSDLIAISEVEDLLGGKSPTGRKEFDIPAEDWPTMGDLIRLADISTSTFQRVREKAGITVSERGAAAQRRAYPPEEVQRLIKAAKVGSFSQTRRPMVDAWTKWLRDHGSTI